LLCLCRRVEGDDWTCAVRERGRERERERERDRERERERERGRERETFLLIAADVLPVLVGLDRFGDPAVVR